MFKSFHVDTAEDLVNALSEKLNLSVNSVEFKKMSSFILSKDVTDTLTLIWKKDKIIIEPVETYSEGRFKNMGFTVSNIASQDSLFSTYTITGFDNLIYSLCEKFKLKPTDEVMIEVKGYLKSLIPAGQTDLTSPCGLYIKKYPIYINALAAYSDMLEMWTTEYVVSCGDKRADLPTFNIS